MAGAFVTLVGIWSNVAPEIRTVLIVDTGQDGASPDARGDAPAARVADGNPRAGYAFGWAGAGLSPAVPVGNID